MREGQAIIVKKKKIVAAGHHGGSWKVAYADFVTAMMAFFMVMWIMGLSADQRAAIAHYFNDPFSPIKSTSESGAAFGLGFPSSLEESGKSGGRSDNLANQEVEANQLIDGLASAMKTLDGSPETSALIESIEFKATDEGLRMEFLEKNGAAFFEIGSAEIRPAARQLIGRIAPFLHDSGRSIVIEGHTDSRPLNRPGYDNMDLSADRAASMKRALEGLGVAKGQITEVRGYGDNKLYMANDPYHWSNRRVSVLLPWGTKSEVVGEPPKELMDQQVQGLFRETYQIAPARPDIRHKPAGKDAFGDPADD